MPTDADYYYLAGIFDGEGCFCISKRGPQLNSDKAQPYRCVMTIIITDKVLIDWLEITFGGTAYEYLPENINHSKRYDWSIRGKKLETLLEILIPKLKIKQRQAMLVLEFVKTMKKTGRTGLSEDIHKKRESLYLECTSLNQEVRR